MLGLGRCTMSGSWLGQPQASRRRTRVRTRGACGSSSAPGAWRDAWAGPHWVACPIPRFPPAVPRPPATRPTTARPAKPWTRCQPRSGRRGATAISRRPRPSFGCRPCSTAPRRHSALPARRRRSGRSGSRLPTAPGSQAMSICGLLLPWLAGQWDCNHPEGPARPHRRRPCLGAAGQHRAGAGPVTKPWRPGSPRSGWCSAGTAGRAGWPRAGRCRSRAAAACRGRSGRSPRRAPASPWRI